MASLIVVFSVLLIESSSTCGPWTSTNPDNGETVTLDLTPLQGLTLDVIDSESPPHHYIWSLCHNNETCNDDQVMVKQVVPGDTYCFTIGRWDVRIQPVYESSNGGTWTFIYPNGDDDCGNPARTWSPKFVCNPAVKYKAGTVDEIPNSCFYEVEVQTRFACANWTTTTTTTSVPVSECIFKSENGNNTLNMTTIRGKLLSAPDSDLESLYFMYTPCENAAKCNDNTTSMAYIFDGMNFECKQYLAVWEDGLVLPNYIEGVGMWEFTYTNGQACNGGQTVFNVVWFCDKSAASPKIIQAKEIADCVYQMVINSTLACG